MLVGMLAIFNGCSSSDDGSSPSDTSADRVAIGKADSSGSCQTSHGNRCGKKSSGNCWRDEQCLKYGDCCSDAESVCGIEPTEGQMCGGFAGIACPSGMTCVDDPNDSCDP